MSRRIYVFIAAMVLAGILTRSEAMWVTNSAVTNVTTTSAWVQFTAQTAAGTAAVYYGVFNYTTNAGSWANASTVAVAAATQSVQLTSLTPATKYYWNWRVVTNGVSSWATGFTNFVTLSGTPTNTPSGSNYAVMVNGAGVIASPTNFASANGLATSGGSFITTNDADARYAPTSEVTRATLAEGVLTTNLTANGLLISNEVTRATLAEGVIETNVIALQSGTSVWNQAAIDASAATNFIATNTVTSGTFDHAALTNVNGAVDVQHLTAAEKAVATNPAAASALEAVLSTGNTATNSITLRAAAPSLVLGAAAGDADDITIVRDAAQKLQIRSGAFGGGSASLTTEVEGVLSAYSIFAGTNDVVNGPYQPYSGQVYSGAGDTATITYAAGNLVRLICTNAPTTITFDNSGYATGGVSRVAVVLWAGTNSVAYNTDVITNGNTTYPTISASEWTSLLFRRVEGETRWKVK